MLTRSLPRAHRLGRSESGEHVDPSPARPPDHNPGSPASNGESRDIGPVPAGRGPTGVTTFLFSDLVGSTSLWERHPTDMPAALARHDELVRRAISEHDGHVFTATGDGFTAAFASELDAIRAAAAIQRAMGAEDWGRIEPMAVRISLHTGVAHERDGDYFGPTLNRVARLLETVEGGQIVASAATEALVVDRLDDGIRLVASGERRLRNLSRPERVFAVVVDDVVSTARPLPLLECCRSRVPAPSGAVAGREREVAEIDAFLTRSGLVTLTGPGGVGKTTLALEVTDRLVERFPDGSFLVALAEVHDPTDVLAAAACALSVGLCSSPEGGDGTGPRPVMSSITDRLVEYVADRRLLIVLDNCEHVSDAAADLAELLVRAGPGVHVLATSREALAIPGERQYPVPPLAIADAVALFIERARAVHPSFDPPADARLAILEICERLDALPLAIELAAARVRALSVQQIATRLDDRFGLLTRGSRTAPRRQQTLRGVVDWSYDLLDEDERRVFERLSVFPGGFSLEAAEAVASLGNPSPGGVVPAIVGDVVARLVDKSLLSADRDRPRVRYHMLQTIAEYAAEHLTARGELADSRDGHAAWCLGLVETAAPRLYRRDQTSWAALLDEEIDNIRAAIDWSATSGDVETAQRLAGALAWYWYVRGPIAEGARHLSRAVGLGGGGIPRAIVTLWGALFDARVHAAGPALAQARAALELARSLDDRSVLAGALLVLGTVASWTGDVVEARAALFEAVEVAEGRDDAEPLLWEQGIATLRLSYTDSQSIDDDTARRYAGRALGLLRAAGDNWGISLALLNIAERARQIGDFSTAAASAQEALAVAQTVRLREFEAAALGELALAEADRGEFVTAAQLMGETRAIANELGIAYVVAQATAFSGVVDRLRGDLHSARQHHERALRVFESIGNLTGAAENASWLAVVVSLLGEHDRAEHLSRSSLEHARTSGDHVAARHCAIGAAAVAANRGDATTAATILGWVDRHHQVPRSLTEPLDRRQAEATARALLDETVYDNAAALGARLELAELVELVGADHSVASPTA